MKIEIKNRYTGKVIFEHEQENNSIKATVELAVKIKIDLSGSYLRGSNLSDSNLSGSDLSGSDLSGSYLSGSNLSDSNLSGSDLSGSNLSGSDLSGSDLSDSNLSGSYLRGSNLRGSNLRGSIGNMKEIFSMQLEQWAIVFTKDMLVIGCQSHKYDEWKAFNDDEISQMSSGALNFWRKWKEFIFKAIELSIGEVK